MQEGRAIHPPSWFAEGNRGCRQAREPGLEERSRHLTLSHPGCAPGVDLAFNPRHCAFGQTDTPWKPPRFFKTIDMDTGEWNSFDSLQLLITEEAGRHVIDLFLILHRLAPKKSPPRREPGGLLGIAAQRDQLIRMACTAIKKTRRCFQLRAHTSGN